MIPTSVVYDKYEAGKVLFSLIYIVWDINDMLVYGGYLSFL